MEKACVLCPNDCKVFRNVQKGRCNSFDKLKIAKYSPFFYEEPIVSGTRGSGAIFFCGCALGCVFCQNYPLSRNTVGKEISDERFIDIVKELEKKGVHNINLVNPTHYYERLANIFSRYKPNVPVISNTSSYEKSESVIKTSEFIDVYLADLKFFSEQRSQRYCGKKNYFYYASSAIKEMVKQKPLIIENGLIKQGVIVRHLILPQNLDETLKILDWYKENVGDKAYLSLMTQYTPYGDIDGLLELKRKLTHREIQVATERLFSLDLQNVFLQEKESANEKYIPEWDF